MNRFEDNWNKRLSETAGCNNGRGINPHPQHNSTSDSFLDASNRFKKREQSVRDEFDDESGDFLYEIDMNGFKMNEIKVKVEGEEIVISGENSINIKGRLFN